jgi:outer membrane protein assembly factor BamD (BamD/ComL family)
MLVTPSTSHFEILYSETALDWFALSTTWLGMLWAVAATVHGGIRRATARGAGAAFRPLGLLLAGTRPRVGVNLALIVLCIVGAFTVRYRIRDLDATYRAGQSAYQERRFDDVIRVHRDYVRDDRDTPKIATALLQLGTAYTEKKQHDLAIETFERLRFDFPNIDYGSQALFHLAKNYSAIGNGERAAEMARLLDQNYAESSWPKRLRKEAPQLFRSPDASAPAVQSSRN